MDFAATPPPEPPPVVLPEPPPEKRVSRWRWWIHLVLIGSYPLVMGLLSAIIGKSKSPALSGTAGGLLFTCSIELLIFGLIFFLGWLASRASREELLLRWRPGWLVIPLGFGYSLALRLAILVVFTVIAGILVATGVVTPAGLQEFSRNNQPDVQSVIDIAALRENPLYFWLSLTFVSFVVAGLREELWRAGFLAALAALWPRWFGSRRGQIAAVTLGAIFFGIGHLSMGIVAVVMTGVLGFLLGVIMVFHRSIWPAVIAHGAFNALTFALLPWMKEIQDAVKPALFGF